MLSVCLLCISDFSVVNCELCEDDESADESNGKWAGKWNAWYGNATVRRVGAM